ncbi:MAG TPA: AEC family transporter [Candidatus Lachnoclostridium avicola]|nr:AEC family transporter [Candidatus Lachnoclostridium avicola]
MNFGNMFNMQGMLFLLMIIGAVLTWKKIITADGQKLLTDLVMDVTLPASIIKSFQMELSRELLESCLEIFLVAIAIQVGTFLLSALLYRGISDEKHRKVLQYATICSNAGVLGNPIAEGIFGSMGLLYASIYLIPQRTFMWSAGLTYFTRCPSKKELARKVLTHPCIIAVAFGMVLLITGTTLPGFLGSTVNSIAGANTAVSMMLIGSFLVGVNVKSMFQKTFYYYSFVRLFLIPFLVFVPCRLLGLDSMVTGVSTILAAMPAASSTAILAAKYECDEVFASKCVVFTTVLSMVTIPVWCLFLA